MFEKQIIEVNTGFMIRSCITTIVVFGINDTKQNSTCDFGNKAFHKILICGIIFLSFSLNRKIHHDDEAQVERKKTKIKKS